MAAYDWRTDPFGYMGDNSPNFIAAGQPEYQRQELNQEKQRISQGEASTYNPINAGLFANQADYDINKTSDYNKFVAGLDRTQAGPNTGPYTNNPTLKWDFLDQTSNAIPTGPFRLPTYEDKYGVTYAIRPGMTPPPDARNVTPNWEKLISGGPAAMGNPITPETLLPVLRQPSNPADMRTLSGGVATPGREPLVGGIQNPLPPDAMRENRMLYSGGKSFSPGAGPSNVPSIVRGGDMIVPNPNYNMGPVQFPNAPSGPMGVPSPSIPSTSGNTGTDLNRPLPFITRNPETPDNTKRDLRDLEMKPLPFITRNPEFSPNVPSSNINPETGLPYARGLIPPNEQQKNWMDQNMKTGLPDIEQKPLPFITNNPEFSPPGLPRNTDRTAYRAPVVPSSMTEKMKRAQNLPYSPVTPPTPPSFGGTTGPLMLGGENGPTLERWNALQAQQIASNNLGGISLGGATGPTLNGYNARSTTGSAAPTMSTLPFGPSTPASSGAPSRPANPFGVGLSRAALMGMPTATYGGGYGGMPFPSYGGMGGYGGMPFPSYGGMGGYGGMPSRGYGGGGYGGMGGYGGGGYGGMGGYGGGGYGGGGMLRGFGGGGGGGMGGYGGMSYPASMTYPSFFG